LEDAMLAAKERDSKIYILITGDHCSWCDKQKEVIASGRVSDAMADFVSCRIDAGSEAAKRYRSRAVPVSIVADGDGSPLKKNVGYMDEDKFLSWIK
jgi:thioredoxin-related protein